jgi:hypothetical protein
MNAVAHGIVVGVQVMRNDAVHLETLMQLEGQHRVFLFLTSDGFDVFFNAGELLQPLAQARQPPGEYHTLQIQSLA